MRIFDRFMHRWHIKIFSFLLAVVFFWFYRISSLDERFFSVPLRVDVNNSFMPAGDYPSHISVTLRGNSEDIFSVLEEDFSASVDFTHHGGEGTFREPIIIHRKGTSLANRDMEIHIEPGDIVIIQEEKMTLTLPVDPALTGFPSLGYELSQYFVSPSSITVIGPKSIISSLESLTTESIDLSGKYEDFTAMSRLNYPSSLVRFPGGDVIEFRGVITESLLVKTIANLDITLLNYNKKFSIKETLPKGSITIKGNQGEIERLSQGEILLSVDCRSITSPGEYTLPVYPDIPGDSALLNWLPKEITIEVSGE